MIVSLTLFTTTTDKSSFMTSSKQYYDTVRGFIELGSSGRQASLKDHLLFSWCMNPSCSVSFELRDGSDAVFKELSRVNSGRVESNQTSGSTEPGISSEFNWSQVRLSYIQSSYAEYLR